MYAEHHYIKSTFQNDKMICICTLSKCALSLQGTAANAITAPPLKQLRRPLPGNKQPIEVSLIYKIMADIQRFT